jgi:hypothetical protein
MTQLTLFDGIQNQEFLEYHKTNPHLYEAFKSVAFDAMNLGFQRYGAKGIFEIIRWKRAESGDGEFKINKQIIDIPVYNYLYDIQITFSDGTVKSSWIYGSFNITNEVTR